MCLWVINMKFFWYNFDIIQRTKSRQQTLHCSFQMTYQGLFGELLLWKLEINLFWNIVEKWPKMIFTTQDFLKYVSPFFNIMHSLGNSGAKYVGNKMRWRFQNFSGCLGNTSKPRQKSVYITLAITSVYLGILPEAMFCVFNSWDYLFYLNYIAYL